jgi:hypothetical protein
VTEILKYLSRSNKTSYTFLLRFFTLCVFGYALVSNDPDPVNAETDSRLANALSYFNFFAFFKSIYL